MNIYLVSRTDDTYYDEYTAAVVVAKSAKDAMTILPSTSPGYWIPANLTVGFIGKAAKGFKRGIVLSQFDAG